MVEPKKTNGPKEETEKKQLLEPQYSSTQNIQKEEILLHQGLRCSNILQIFNPLEEKVSNKLEIFNGMFFKACETISLPGLKIQSIGGIEKSQKKELLQIDVPKKQFLKKSDMIFARCNFGLCQFKNDIFVIAGCNNEGFLSTCECYNITNDKWIELPCIPNAISTPATSVFDDYIWVIGGYDNQGFQEKIYKLHLKDRKKWENVEFSGNFIGRQGACAFPNLGKSLMILGGFISSGRSADIFILSSENEKNQAIEKALENLPIRSYFARSSPAVLLIEKQFVFDSDGNLWVYNMKTCKCNIVEIEKWKI